MLSSSSSPCAACKYLRRKCTSSCIFAPYFPPDEPTKFANIHQIFGASNVKKILADLPASQREDAVNSLSYEANARILNPYFGCVAAVYDLQRRIKEMQAMIAKTQTELSAYVGDSAFNQITPPYVTRFTTVGSAQVDLAQPQIVIKEEEDEEEEDNQPQGDVQQQMTGAMEVEAVARSEHETMMGTDSDGLDALPDGLGLGGEDGFCISSPNEWQIQMPPEFMHHQEHDGTMNNNGTSG